MCAVLFCFVLFLSVLFSRASPKVALIRYIITQDSGGCSSHRSIRMAAVLHTHSDSGRTGEGNCSHLGILISTLISIAS